MPNPSMPYKLKLTLKIIMPAILIILLASQAFAISTCKKVKGKFTLQKFSGPDCTSPVSFCAVGVFTGDLAGTSSFIGTSMVPSIDTPTTGVIFLTGDKTLTVTDGTLLTKDALSLNRRGNGELAEVDSIVGGTGKFAGYTGKFTATGTYVEGSGVGTYNGMVCAP